MSTLCPFLYHYLVFLSPKWHHSEQSDILLNKQVRITNKKEGYMNILSIITSTSILFLLLSGCMQTKPEIKMNLDSKKVTIDLNKFTVNKTTSSEIEKTLGLPLGVRKDPDGKSSFMYYSECNGGQIECVTRFIFNDKKVLIKSQEFVRR